MYVHVDCDAAHEYVCPDGVCIPHERLCDNIQDCTDNSDEDSSRCGEYM